jgi:Tol biopolymer transport system component
MRMSAGRSIAWVTVLALAACTSGPTETNANESSRETPTSSATASPATVVADTPPAAFLLDVATGTQTPLAKTSAENDSNVAFDSGYYYVPSPDGSQMYLESPETNASVVANIDGSEGRRLDPQGDVDYYAGGWSPDGTKIVYQRRDSSGDDFGNLVVEDIASGRTTQITDLEQPSDDVDGWWYLAPTFSADGRTVIYHWPVATSSGIDWDLWSVPVTGAEEPALLVKNAAEPATTDGETWAFVRPTSDFFAGSTLVLATPEGSRKLVEANEDIFEPKISPDGSKIAYQDGGSIYVVDVSTGETSDVAVGRMADWVDDDTLVVAPDA